MSRLIQHGSTGQSVVVRFLDSTTGAPETGVDHSTAGLALWYRREGGLKVAITPAALADLETAHTDGGVEPISDGYVRVDVPDAAFLTGASQVAVGGSATGMVVVAAEVELVAYNPGSSVPQTADVAAVPTALLAATVDGVALSTIFTHLLSLGVGGKFTYDADTGVLERFAQDGVTSLGQITLTPEGGTPV